MCNFSPQMMQPIGLKSDHICKFKENSFSLISGQAPLITELIAAFNIIIFIGTVFVLQPLRLNYMAMLQYKYAIHLASLPFQHLFRAVHGSCRTHRCRFLAFDGHWILGTSWSILKGQVNYIAQGRVGQGTRCPIPAPQRQSESWTGLELECSHCSASQCECHL